MKRCREGTTYGTSVYSAVCSPFMSSQFQAAMLFKDSVLLDRLFMVFDKNDDEHISFSEFVTCVTKLSTKASESDKLRCMAAKLTPICFYLLCLLLCSFL
jgi:hypothetical protein